MTGNVTKINSKIKVGLYPGSFNPIHEGHADVLTKALRVFDAVNILVCNPIEEEAVLRAKRIQKSLGGLLTSEGAAIVDMNKIGIQTWSGLFAQYVLENDGLYTAVIRGLRNGTDLQYEQNLMYAGEDLGINIPTAFFLTDRTMSHISSSLIRELDRYKPINNQEQYRSDKGTYP